MIVCGIVYYFIGSPYGIALFIGFASHLVIDGFTKQGTSFLHPLARLHLSGFIETGKVGEWVVFFLCIIGCAVFILKYLPF